MLIFEAKKGKPSEIFSFKYLIKFFPVFSTLSAASSANLLMIQKWDAVWNLTKTERHSRRNMESRQTTDLDRGTVVDKWMDRWMGEWMDER